MPSKRGRTAAGTHNRQPSTASNRQLPSGGRADLNGLHGPHRGETATQSRKSTGEVGVVEPHAAHGTHGSHGLHVGKRHLALRRNHSSSKEGAGGDIQASGKQQGGKGEGSVLQAPGMRQGDEAVVTRSAATILLPPPPQPATGQPQAVYLSDFLQGDADSQVGM